MTDRPTSQDAPDAAAGRAAASPAGASRRGGRAAPPPPVQSGSTLARAVPGFAFILVADLAVVWAAVSGSWTALVVIDICIVDGLADGFFAWLRARASWAAGTADDQRDRMLVREFLRTYLVVMVAMALVAYLVFSGRLLKPRGGEVPLDPGGPFLTWQFWTAAALLVAMRGFLYYWDFVRGGEARIVPPAAVVSEPLRRLFMLQFGVLIAALVVYWLLDSAVAGLATVLVAKTAIDLVLAVLERLRVARITAAVTAGAGLAPRQAPKPRARRGGRKRRR